jgi:hypothetical protein
MTSDPNSDPDSPEFEIHRVIIAAAVTALFGGQADIREIRTIQEHAPGSWVRAGRMAIQASHRVAPLVAAGSPRSKP